MKWKNISIIIKLYLIFKKFNNIYMNIAIIGGGIAGLSAATVLQELGNHVTIFESHNELGGLVRSHYDKLSHYQEHSPRVFLGNYHNFYNIMRRIPVYYQKMSTNKMLIDVFQKLENSYLVNEYGLTSVNIFKMLFNSKLNLLEMIMFGFFILRYMVCSTERLEDDADRIPVKNFIKNKEGIKRFKMLSHIIGEPLDKLPLHKIVRLIEQNLLPRSNKILKGNNNEFLFHNWELYLRSITATIVKNRIVERIKQENSGKYTINTDKGEFKGFTKIIVATDLWNMIKLFENSNIKIHQHVYELAEESRSNQMGINIYFNTLIKFKTKSMYALENSDWKLIIEPKDNNWKRDSKEGIWSVSIPDDNLFSKRLNKMVKDCNPNEIYKEVWEQISESKIFDGIKDISKDQIVPIYFKIWDGWEITKDSVSNIEPYFLNATSTYGKRLSQDIGLKDIFIAGAHTKTSYYHYWVEGACESGLNCAKLIDYRVNIIKHDRIKLFKIFHKIDKLLYDQYLPNIFDISIILIFGLVLYKKLKF